MAGVVKTPVYTFVLAKSQLEVKSQGRVAQTKNRQNWWRECLSGESQAKTDPPEPE